MARAAPSTETVESSSWAKLQVSPDTIGSVKYGDIRIDIYEHTRNEKTISSTPSSNRYFYAPLSLLNHKSVNSIFNNNANQA